LSSILDALKKIEEESIQTSGLRPRIKQTAGAGDRVRFFLIDRALVLFFAAGLISLGAGGFWAYSTFYNAPAEMQTASIAESVPPTLAAPRPTRPATVHPQKDDPVRPTTEHYARTPEPAAPPAPVRENRPAASAPPVPEPAPAQPEATKIDPEIQPERESSTVVRSEFIPPKASAPDMTPELEGSSLMLQAISWATRPENRIAVINGKICREGEKIDGFIIRQINQDDVRVVEGGHTSRLVFRIK